MKTPKTKREKIVYTSSKRYYQFVALFVFLLICLITPAVVCLYYSFFRSSWWERALLRMAMAFFAYLAIFIYKLLWLGWTKGFFKIEDMYVYHPKTKKKKSDEKAIDFKEIEKFVDKFF